MPKNVFKSNLALAAVLNLVSTMLHILFHWSADWGEEDSSPKKGQDWLDATGCPEIVVMWWSAIATFTATFLIEFDRFLAIA